MTSNLIRVCPLLAAFLLATESGHAREDDCPETDFPATEADVLSTDLELLVKCINQLKNTGRVPPGAVAAFDLDVCPRGWSDYSGAAGKFVLGAGEGKLRPRRNDVVEGNEVTLSQRWRNDQGGEEEHVLQESEVPQHVHPLDAVTLEQYYAPGARLGLERAHEGTQFIIMLPGNGASQRTQETLKQNVGGAAHNNMPPYIVLRFCKKDE